jgi:hypothetical protein
MQHWAQLAALMGTQSELASQAKSYLAGQTERCSLSVLGLQRASLYPAPGLMPTPLHLLQLYDERKLMCACL